MLGAEERILSLSVELTVSFRILFLASLVTHVTLYCPQGEQT